MQEVSLLDLLKSGAHFGHTTSRWNPKMKPFIYSVRNNVHILDLAKTKESLEKAGKFVEEVASKGGTVLFVGTKRQIKQSVGDAAVACSMPYVNVRWLGGTFTNFKTIQKTIRKLEKLIDLKMSGKLETQYTKKERLLIEREIQKLEKLFAGIKNLKRIPDAIVIADINRDDIALAESIKARVPVVALVDSNSDPSLATYPIPCNDDATRAVDLILTFLSQSVQQGRSKMQTKAPVDASSEKPQK